MTTLTLSIREYPCDKELDLNELTELGLNEILGECEALLERVKERLNGENNDERVED